MDGNFTSILIILIFQLALLSIEVRGAEKYFQDINDPLVAEQLAVSASQMEAQTGSEIAAQDEIAQVVESDPISETIFSRNPREIIRLCADAIPIDMYGFRFELDKYSGPKTVKRPFQVKHIESPENDLLRLEMLNCPRVSYSDLEINKKLIFFDIFLLSKATTTNSAIVFKRGHVDNSIHPLRCITNISFEKLAELSKTAINFGPRFVPNEIKEVLDAQLIVNKINTYQTLKRSSDVYTYIKFTRLFHSFAVCSLPRTHKIHTCRQAVAANSSSIKLNVSEYFDEPCKKRLVHLSYGETKGSSETAELYIARCPPTLNVSVFKELRQTIMFYIASTTSPRSVVLFSRLNEKGEKIQPFKVVYNVNVQAMKQDKERTKISTSLSIPLSPEWRSSKYEYENLKKMMKVSFPKLPVQMPATLARQPNQMRKLRRQQPLPTRFWHGASVTELALIEFSHIKKIVLAYQKFRETYTSIDFCSLDSLQKKSLCDEALSDPEYGLIPTPRFTSKLRPCYRQKVALTSFEADRLQTETFSMWACPPSLNHPKLVYYMGKTHLRDAALLYRDVYYSAKSDKMNAIHPVTLFLQINRYKLVSA